MSIDRRKKTRISVPLPISISGSGDQHHLYRFETVSWDFGSGGLCAFSPRKIEKGERISLSIRLALTGSNPALAPRVAARAVVLRSQSLPDGAYMFAASFLWRHVI